MKVCYRCHDPKPLTEFYENSRMKDGRLGKCKDCTRKDVTTNRLKNHTYYAAFDKARASLPHRVAQRKQYQNETVKGKEVHRKAAQKWLASNPEAYHAHTVLNNAVRNGKIKKQPCQFCGATVRIHGHHDDYTKPLDVVWACPKHHKQLEAGTLSVTAA